MRIHAVLRLVSCAVLFGALLATGGCGDDDDGPSGRSAGSGAPDAGSGGANAGSGGGGGSAGGKDDAGISQRTDGGEMSCTTIAAWALRLEVDLEQDWRCEDIEATAVDGAFSERMMRFTTTAGPPSCEFAGATERSGKYDVRLEGYGRSMSIPGIVVRDVVCHVDTERRRVRFTRACTEAIDQDDAGIDDDDAGTPPDDCVTEL